MTRRFAILGVLLLAAAQAAAATWAVRADGSGDFIHIQDAIDAAASGDTIDIGPGRYDSFSYQFPGGWTIGRIEGKSLDFVGAGTDQTFIGPETDSGIDSDFVWCFLVMSEGLTTKFRNITFENVRNCSVRIEGAGRGEFEDCLFRGSGGAFFGRLANGGFFRRCQFIDLDTDIEADAIGLMSPTHNVEIRDCSFDHVYIGVGAYWDQTDGVVVQDCVFDGGDAGIHIADGASGEVRNCRITNMQGYGVVGNSPGTVVIEDNTIEMPDVGHPNYCVNAYYPPGDYIVRNNILRSHSVIFGLFTPQISLECENNQLLRMTEETWYVRPAESGPIYNGPIITLDLGHNWWGTDDASEVSAWIWDHNDDEAHKFVVDFEPMNGVVRTEARSWGAIKRLFGD
ncbi:MAG: right-handed parallel beta-helix repeat-containing protein [Candidatus Krumholzibacteriia bacterium]